MKHLLHVLKAKGEQKKAPHNKSRKRYDFNKNYLIFKINGYWWRLTQTQWSKHLQIAGSTLYTRKSLGYPMDQVLGFTEIPRGTNRCTKD